MKFIYALILICLCRVSAQWTEFDFSRADPGNRKEILPIILQGALSAGHTPFYLPSSSKRLRFGFSLSRGFDLSGSGSAQTALNFIPVVQASFLVTSNLNLRGKIGTFSSSNLLNQISAFGFGLQLSKPEQTRFGFWEMDVEIGRLRSSSKTNLGLLEVSLKYMFNLKGLPVFMGFGSNHLKGSVFYLSNPGAALKITKQTNYLTGGTVFKFGSMNLSPQFAAGSSFLSLFLDFYTEFN
ncbi:MAG: hypothetical protein V3S22_02125 [Candidatus Neomarinimicrobiota bacterium]